MRRHRISFLIVGAGCVALAAALLGVLTNSASGQVKGQSTVKKPVVVTVTAGKPGLFGFTLSKKSLITVGAVSFKVTNKGVLSHDFKICTAPVKSDVKNSCVGKVTPLLKPGKSATLTVTLKKGEYEYLCAVAGHAASGMKGLIGIGVKVTAAPKTTTTTKTVTTTTTKTTTTGATTTTSTAPPVFPTGNASNGANVYVSAGCGSCHTLAAAQSTGTVGPDLDHSNLTVAQVENQVYYGGGDMPPFGGPNGSLSNQQIADVATYVSQNSQ
jgi:mono/diheme cytochrome c family protein